MVFERIEALKREYTDKYVVVDESRPELARFYGQVGVVKTINMNGRALVEFQDYIANIGWFDIDLDFVTVVPKPEATVVTKVEKPAAKKAPAAEMAAPAKPAEKTAEKPAAKQPAAAGEKKLSPIELARMQGAAKGAGAPAPAKSKPAAVVAEKSSVPIEGKKPSTAEILAAARSKRAAAPDNSADATAQTSAPAETEPSSVTREKAVVAVEANAPTPAKPIADRLPASAGPKPTTTSEKIAWCRRADEGRNTR
jgi:hypothetical protein